MVTGIIVVYVTTGVSECVVNTQRPQGAGGRLLVSPKRDKSSTCQFQFVMCFLFMFSGRYMFKIF